MKITNKKNIGLILFFVFLLLTVVEFIFFLRVGNTVLNLEQVFYFLDLFSKIGLISKMLIVAMFGLIFIEVD